MLGLTDLLGQSCVISLCGFLWLFLYIFGFPQVVHVIDLCVRPYCSRLFVLCHKPYTYFLCQDWAGKEVARGNIHSKILNWETFNPYLDGLILGKVWKAYWEKFVFNWENFGTFCETLIWFFGKICCWENLELVNLNINFNILVGKILLGVFLPKLVGKFAILGVFFENVPVGELVWNIGEIFEILTWENFCLGTLVNLLKISSWEHLVKVGKISIWEMLL